MGMAISQRNWDMEVPTSLWSLDTQGPQEATQEPQQPRRLVCLCAAIVLSFHTPVVPDVQPQWAGLTCKQAAFAGGWVTCSPCESLPGEVHSC